MEMIYGLYGMQWDLMGVRYIYGMYFWDLMGWVQTVEVRIRCLGDVYGILIGFIWGSMGFRWDLCGI